jgi:hypothetical protein
MHASRWGTSWCAAFVCCQALAVTGLLLSDHPLKCFDEGTLPAEPACLALFLFAIWSGRDLWRVTSGPCGCGTLPLQALRLPIRGHLLRGRTSCMLRTGSARLITASARRECAPTPHPFVAPPVGGMSRPRIVVDIMNVPVSIWQLPIPSSVRRLRLTPNRRPRRRRSSMIE